MSWAVEPHAALGEGGLLAGRYLLLEQIGRGGMGRVWRAQDQVLDREVAVKELSVSGLSPEELASLQQRMQREARAAARVKHPGVLAVHDVLEENGRPWIVMELIDGQSLADIIATEGTLLPRDAARVGVQLVGALDRAHRLGVLHRDVKPANVLIERGGRVVLSDFGIAMLDGVSGLTRTGDVVGSPDYLAPECATGHRPGPASDLWSLGATLYAAVEGRAPFSRSSSLSTLQAVIAEPLPEPRSAGALKSVIEALLRKDPEDRPSAEATLGMLERVAGSTGAEYAPTELATEATDGTDTVVSPAQGTVVGSGGAQEGSAASGTRAATAVTRRSRSAGARRRRPTRIVLVVGAVAALAAGGAVWAISAGGTHSPSTSAAVNAPTARTSSAQPVVSHAASAPVGTVTVTQGATRTVVVVPPPAATVTAAASPPATAAPGG